ncbi:hypothetical protein CIHG_10379 [Coccidioides immitis H538.4]|uniref:Uncharacterized protein n=2 Tax=Coccidioides immitis TaxID=5501 RepID=A0A0J8S876_COCIT|nr:hypothetical protein CIRG_05152 [Coccidioides immitis RMSCC 2394]KMU92589.1 hypothetical protein CIHG_10379 [Coccidioides immitis H538.4]
MRASDRPSTITPGGVSTHEDSRFSDSTLPLQSSPQPSQLSTALELPESSSSFSTESSRAHAFSSNHHSSRPSRSGSVARLDHWLHGPYPKLAAAGASANPFLT